jgi:hypothetical protein
VHRGIPRLFFRPNAATLRKGGRRIVQEQIELTVRMIERRYAMLVRGETVEELEGVENRKCQRGRFGRGGCNGARRRGRS